VVVFGTLSMLASAGAGTLVAWQNRNAVVRVHVADTVWTVRLYGLLVVGALLACWFLLGAAFIQCRLAELRRARAAERDPTTPGSAAAVGQFRARRHGARLPAVQPPVGQ
jgi:hypothetical protein